jgi:hypothetical protein
MYSDRGNDSAQRGVRGRRRVSEVGSGLEEGFALRIAMGAYTIGASETPVT